MLLRRYYDNTAEGATNNKKVAPKPTHIEEKIVTPENKIKEEKPEEKKITQQDIMKMNVATVRAYAKEQGIEDADEKSGAELKRILIDRLFEESE